MTPEQLLNQRYKVIAPYPGSPFYVGKIIEKHKFLSGKWHIPNFHYDPADFPNIFQPLPWYADRKIEDMPEYIKCEERVWKVTEWRTDIVGRFFPMNEVDVEGESENFANIKWHFKKEKFVPCTLADYEQWKQSKNK